MFVLCEEGRREKGERTGGRKGEWKKGSVLGSLKLCKLAFENVLSDLNQNPYMISFPTHHTSVVLANGSGWGCVQASVNKKMYQNPCC